MHDQDFFDRICDLPLERIDERLRRYRLQRPGSEQAMSRSLQRYGQLSPVVVCQQDETPVMIDGFKRLQAARKLKGMNHLQARFLAVDEQGAKAAVYTLNCLGGQVRELEEAWIVHALVREDGLSQTDAGELLGRHKSWVNRRLALLERLALDAQQDLRLGLLSPSMARELTRLPVGNQAQALQAAREASLTSGELRGVVDLLQASSSSEQTKFVLQDPRRALRQAEDAPLRYWDPRMSPTGNRIAKQLSSLLNQLGKMKAWLPYRGRGELRACDRELLLPGLQRLIEEASLVAESTADFVSELKQAGPSME